MTFRPFDPFVLPQAPLATLRRRVEYQERALDQARSDLAAEKARKGLATEGEDDKEDKLAKYRREGALAERERIRLILTSPAAARQTRLADVYAFETDTPAADPIAMME